MAIRHGATIVPFAAVGAEDALEIVADSDDVSSLPFGLGDAALERSRAVPRARCGHARDGRRRGGGDVRATHRGAEAAQTVLFQVWRANLHRGLRTKDEEKVREVYARVRGDVEDGVDWLLRKRGGSVRGYPHARVGRRRAGRAAHVQTFVEKEKGG